jgi:hypothetical protein
MFFDEHISKNMLHFVEIESYKYSIDYLSYFLRNYIKISQNCFLNSN